MGREVEIPWLGGSKTMDRGVKIPWIGSSIYHGEKLQQQINNMGL
jgi:hypothetical protein